MTPSAFIVVVDDNDVGKMVGLVSKKPNEECALPLFAAVDWVESSKVNGSTSSIQRIRPPRCPGRNFQTHVPVMLLLLLLSFISDITTVSSLSMSADSISSRRDFFDWSKQQAISSSIIMSGGTSTTLFPPLSSAAMELATTEQIQHPFRYSTEWTGTHLQLLSLEQAVQQQNLQMPMAKWPDPILRRPAQPVDSRWFGSDTLLEACQLLQQTAQQEGAVGLAAQQCGVNARLVYVESPNNRKRDIPLVMINPQIVGRSPETQMCVWEEHCLVLPPTFVATVLRDAWIDVRYRNCQGQEQTIRFTGEASRCVQHELDHDRGILVTDHVGLEELENDVMRTIERPGHDQRMVLAYARNVESTTNLSS